MKHIKAKKTIGKKHLTLDSDSQLDTRLKLPKRDLKITKLFNEEEYENNSMIEEILIKYGY